MLTFEDKPTIENAIWKRLHEPGKTEIADIEIKNVAATPTDPAHIQVGVWCVLKDRIGFEGLIDTRSFFDLPATFDHAHLLNEIDQIYEQMKEVRRTTAATRLLLTPEAMQRRQMTKGTGLRGLWKAENNKAADRQ